MNINPKPVSVDEFKQLQFNQGRGALDIKKTLPNNDDIPFHSANDAPPPISFEIANPTIEDRASFREGDILPPVTQGGEYRVPAVMRGIDFSKIESRIELLRALTANLPRNEFNLPKFIYRPDMIDINVCKYATNSESAPAASDPFTDTLLIPQPAEGRAGAGQIADMLQAAQVPLLYDEGYPAFPNGLPFWYKLPFEPDDAYMRFVRYLEAQGARTLVSEELKGFQHSELWEFSHLYYWQMRAVSYDLFKQANQARKRIQRAMGIEDDHFEKATKALAKVYSALENKDQEAIAAMDADKLVKMMDTLAKMQRVAAGLPANGGESEQKMPSVEVAIRSVASAAMPGPSQDEMLDELGLLENPHALAAAQELIVRVGRK